MLELEQSLEYAEKYITSKSHDSTKGRQSMCQLISALINYIKLSRPNIKALSKSLDIIIDILEIGPNDRWLYFKTIQLVEIKYDINQLPYDSRGNISSTSNGLARTVCFALLEHLYTLFHICGG